MQGMKIMSTKKNESPVSIDVMEVQQGRMTIAIVGTTPFIHNRVSEKGKRELLLPRGKKTTAEKAQSLKHDPLREWRASPYTILDDAAPTLMAFLAVGPKRAAMTAALDIPGAKKTQIGRLMRVEGERLPLYGIPQMHMTIVRSADMNRTPDIRTRAITPRWAMLLDVTFAKPMLREKAVLNLFAAGGMFVGVGDWRTEKGSGNYGSFRLAGADDAELRDILATGGRAAQIAAFNVPSFYDQESEELFTWYTGEVAQRGFKVAS
jgi:hypothetical protein